ncbi:hypothetical protein BU15DRAFT_51080, partial [Melanogaster broomeanus]
TMSTTPATTTILSAVALAPTVPAIEPVDDHPSYVRFDTQCVVIPEPTQRTRMPSFVTRPYSISLWKRRVSGPSGSTKLEDPTSREDHVVLRILLPKYVVQFSTNPQSSTHSPDRLPLAPCLVHRSPSVASSTSGSPPLTRSTSRKTSPSLAPHSDVLTAPLQTCYTPCQTTTEEALVDGGKWTEPFSRAERTRRTLSVDGAGAVASFSALRHGVPITANETDKHRRSSDTWLPKTGQEMRSFNHARDGDGDGRRLSLLRPAISRRLTDARSPPPPARMTPSATRIPEEEHDDDAHQLFPLPRSRRTPASSLTVDKPRQNSTISLPPSSLPTTAKEGRATKVPSSSLIQIHRSLSATSSLQSEELI